jgi:hypothetical protein
MNHVLALAVRAEFVNGKVSDAPHGNCHLFSPQIQDQNQVLQVHIPSILVAYYYLIAFFFRRWNYEAFHHKGLVLTASKD